MSCVALVPAALPVAMQTKGSGAERAAPTLAQRALFARGTTAPPGSARWAPYAVSR
jgi:hypothetical protein